MIKEKRILSYFIGWLILGLFICFVGITKTDALVIDGKFQGQAVNTNLGIDANSYIQNNSYITVDESNALNYYVAEICTTNNVFSISNVSSQSGNVSYSRSITNIKSCNTTNYTGTLAKVYFKINQWADAGNGNFGVIFNFRLNSNVSYYTDIRVMNIYTTNEIDETSELLNNQTNELNNSINNSTNTITGSIGDAENNINSNIDDMEQSIVDSNKETQDVIKDQFNSCRDSINLAYDVTYAPGKNDWWTLANVNSTNIIKGKTYTVSVYLNADNNTIAYWNNSSGVFNGKIFNITPDNNRYSYTFTALKDATNVSVILSKSGNGDNVLITPSKLQIQEGDVATNYEEPNTEICKNKLDEQNETSKGIWATIKELPSMFLDMLLGLFIPEDLSFIENFKDVISNKLGFIASIPIQIIDFMLGLADVAFSEITTISFPSIEIFGVHFWNAEDIDITILLEKLKPFKYFTDLTCVILCCRTLYNFYHSFTGGDAN